MFVAAFGGASRNSPETFGKPTLVVEDTGQKDSALMKANDTSDCDVV
jgi:hypothetical protein